MLGVALEVRTQCAKCGQPLPLNACAPTFVCGSCGHPTAISDQRWSSLFEDVVTDALALAAGEGKTRTIMTGGATYSMMIGNQPARCGACKTALPDEAYAFVDRGWTICVGCGARMSLRRAPAPLAAMGVEMVVGEETAQLAGAAGAAPKASQPIVFYCANCKAPLTVDGSNRVVRCQYCATDVYLPDDLWQRLHPVATVARWYLCVSAAQVAARVAASWGWYSLEDCLIDAEKNIYCGGESSDSVRAVWCMAPDLTLRWYKELPELTNDVLVALDPTRGYLLARAQGKHSALILSARDGSPVGKLGGRQPDDAAAHTFDLEDCHWLRVDVDGTFLALVHERLLRFSPDGQGVATWPPRAGIFGKKAEKLHPIYGPGHQAISVDAAGVDEVKSQPHTLRESTRFVIGWDGRLYVARHEHAACFDRAGERVYSTRLPISSIPDQFIGADAAGNLYIPAELSGNPSPRVIVRVSPDGKRVDTIATDRRQGGVVGGEDKLVVAPDGTMVLLNYNMRVRVITPDGRLAFQSAKSREDDADEDRRAAATD